MELYIIRHGIAAERSGRNPDSERALTAEGIEKMQVVGKGLRLLGVRFDLILSSPYIRAMQTAKIIAAETGYPEEKIQKTDILAPAGDWEKIFQLTGKAQIVGIFGHDPMFSEMVSEILGADSMKTPVKKGGVCKLSLSPKNPYAAELEWFIPPKVFSELLKG